MGSRYLTELADWLRDEGLLVLEYAGWETRARSSGGFDHNRPWCVMWHHTASKASPASDADYMCHGSPDRPIANLLVARTGEVWLLAAGATNTNGKGGPRSFSRGTVPIDSMNTYAVGIEIANDGLGEPYPQIQIDAALAASLAITAGLGLEPTDVDLHQQYAPDRKIDPATAAAVQGPWRPASTTSSGTWSLADLRAELTRRAAGPTPTPPEDEMPRQLVRNGDTTWNAWVVWDGGKFWLPTGEAIAIQVDAFGYDPLDVDADWMRATGPVYGPNPTADPYGVWTD